MEDENQKRTNIEDLPRAEEALSDEEAKGVEGGAGSNTYRGTTTVNEGSLARRPDVTIGSSLAADPSDPSGKL